MGKQKVIPERYRFNDVPVNGFPKYMRDSLMSWSKRVLRYEKFCDKYCSYLTENFMGDYQVVTRTVYDSNNVNVFLGRIFSNTDETIIFLQIMLNNFGADSTIPAGKSFGDGLERILAMSGSAYAAELIDDKWALVERTPKIVKDASSDAISSNALLAEAWGCCYGVRPDYDATVRKSIDALETLMKEKYLPEDEKPQIGKQVKSIKESSRIEMDFRGCDTLDDPKVVLELIKNLTGYRGEHTGGTGEHATKDIAEYALHTAIWFWSLHS
ncbi:hypothetical protein IKW75_01515 [Candidatus Saccharibacteria bacterium]|nr:hypothetical protein [Candidatus Saccharibacteria bacterium]